MPSEQNRVAETTTEFSSLRPSRVVTERDVETYKALYDEENAPLSTVPVAEAPESLSLDARLEMVMDDDGAVHQLTPVDDGDEG